MKLLLVISVGLLLASCMNTGTDSVQSKRCDSTLFSNVICDSSGYIQWQYKTDQQEIVFVIYKQEQSQWVEHQQVEFNTDSLDSTGGLFNFKWEMNCDTGYSVFYVTNFQDRYCTSDTVTWLTADPFLHGRCKDELALNFECSYRVYDALGNMVNEGYGDTIDFVDKPKGVYYLYCNGVGGKVLRH